MGEYIELIAEIAPKNDAFQYLVDASRVRGLAAEGGRWTAPNLTGETLGGHRLMTIDPVTGGVVYADCTTLSHAGLPIGLTTAATEAGAVSSMQVAGEVTEVSWAWTPGQELFLGENGMLTSYANLPAGCAFDRRVAIARTATIIVLEILVPIVR